MLPPLLQQQQIVQSISSMKTKTDALKSTQAGTSRELDALLQSALDKAFEGNFDFFK
jgi:hypothetical protein